MTNDLFVTFSLDVTTLLEIKIKIKFSYDIFNLVLPISISAITEETGDMDILIIRFRLYINYYHLTIVAI